VGVGVIDGFVGVGGARVSVAGEKVEVELGFVVTTTVGKAAIF